MCVLARCIRVASLAARFWVGVGVERLPRGGDVSMARPVLLKSDLELDRCRNLGIGRGEGRGGLALEVIVVGEGVLP